VLLLPVLSSANHCVAYCVALYKVFTRRNVVVRVKLLTLLFLNFV